MVETSFAFAFAAYGTFVVDVAVATVAAGPLVVVCTITCAKRTPQP